MAFKYRSKVLKKGFITNTIKIKNVKKINKIKQDKVKRTKFWQGKTKYFRILWNKTIDFLKNLCYYINIQNN